MITYTYFRGNFPSLAPLYINYEPFLMVLLAIWSLSCICFYFRLACQKITSFSLKHEACRTPGRCMSVVPNKNTFFFHLSTATTVSKPLFPSVPPTLFSFDNINYNVKWKFNGSLNKINFRVEVNATGHIGFDVVNQAVNNMVGYNVAFGGVLTGSGELRWLHRVLLNVDARASVMFL